MNWTKKMVFVEKISSFVFKKLPRLDKNWDSKEIIRIFAAIILPK